MGPHARPSHVERRDPRANASAGTAGPSGLRPNRLRWPSVDRQPIPSWEPARQPPRRRRQAL